jgi:membrane protein implicated in regulation of membrane protease activity
MEASFFWMALAVALLVGEALTLGVFMLFFGFGALITGLALYILPLSFSAQILVFLFSSVCTLLLMRNTMRAWLVPKNKSVTTDNIEDIIGRRAIVTENIDPPKFGLVDLKGTNWKAMAEKKLMKGSTVEVIGRENLVLKVKLISN